MRSRSSPCTLSRFLTNSGSSSLGEIGLQPWILAACLVEQVLDQLLLFGIEGDHPNREPAFAEARRRQARHHVGHQRLRFGRVGPCTAFLVSAGDWLQADRAIVGDGEGKVTSPPS